ncbi:uncharacterized protein LOC120588753 isoform X2 [Pteropus medius]|uniref:uncharacterized protein LOC120588753 isoform X2 n=1 Tax=Pteropus vampyrus TaxID=132908 RepID=UPI00196AB5D4|nr:uncharacterized protein LOC120588753 isoform X2 [Pteropus giganteus]
MGLDVASPICQLCTKTRHVEPGKARGFQALAPSPAFVWTPSFLSLLSPSCSVLTLCRKLLIRVRRVCCRLLRKTEGKALHGHEESDGLRPEPGIIATSGTESAVPLRSVPGTAAPLPPAPPAGSAGSAGSVPRHLVVLASASVQVCIPPPGHQISTFTTPSDVAQAATTDGSGPALRRGLTLGAVPWLPLITLVSLAPSESGLNGLMVLIVTTVDFPQTSCHPATSLPESGHSWGLAFQGETDNRPDVLITAKRCSPGVLSGGSPVPSRPHNAACAVHLPQPWDRTQEVKGEAKAVGGTEGETPWTVCGITRASRHERGHCKIRAPGASLSGESTQRRRGACTHSLRGPGQSAGALSATA